MLRSLGAPRVSASIGMSERRTRDLLTGRSFPKRSHLAGLLDLAYGKSEQNELKSSELLKVKF
jgi:hypothetical protein